MTAIRYTFVLGLVLSGCGGAPALSDGLPDSAPDPGRKAVAGPTAWHPDGSAVPAGPVGTPRAGKPIAQNNGPVKIDGEGTRYTPQSRRLGFLPVPVYVAGAINYQRSGGGLVRVIETPGQPPGEPPSQPPGEPPGRPPGVQVPGPAPWLGLGAAFAFARQLRRRISRPSHQQPSTTPHHLYGFN